MPTDAQIKYAVRFWEERLSRAVYSGYKVPQEGLDRFRKALAKVLTDDPTIRSACCNYGPQETLSLALKEVKYSDKMTLADFEPPILVDDVGMIFNPDGTIDIRENRAWERIVP